jgi:hypothetical protein
MQHDKICMNQIDSYDIPVNFVCKFVYTHTHTHSLAGVGSAKDQRRRVTYIWLNGQDQQTNQPILNVTRPFGHSLVLCSQIFLSGICEPASYCFSSEFRNGVSEIGSVSYKW